MDAIEIIKRILNESFNQNDLSDKRRFLDKNILSLFKESSYDNLEENEDTNKREDVLNKIRNNQFEPPDPKNFKNGMEKSKHLQMLTPYSEEDLSKMKLFKLDGYDIGFAIKKSERNEFDELVAVFNNEPDVKNIGNELVNSAIQHGGCYLDHYDGYLSSLYKSLGYIEYDRYEFDPKYDPDGKFEEKYGKADVIFRKHKSC